MKRVHFISILAALLVAGCSEETRNSLLTENMITFSEHGSDTFASSTRGVADKNMSQQSQVFKLETGNVSEAPLYLIATTEDYASSPQTQQSGTTRGTEVTTFGSFGWFALDGSTAVYENSVATSAGSVFTTGEYWPADLLATPSKTYGFLAYYPRLTSTSYGLTLDAKDRTITYDATSASVADQQDLMAAFTTRGYSGGDAVPLVFKHLCTAVKIKTAKDFTHTVKRVAFKNIFTTGVCSLTSTAPYHIWNATVQSTDYKVYDDATGVTGVTGTEKDVLTGSSTLFMIPQSFTSSNQMIEVVINDGTTDHTLTTTLNGSEWIAGKVVTYTISRSAIVALTSLTVEYPLWKNNNNDNVYGPVFRYEGDDYFGLFAVDNSTHKIFRSNVKVGVSFGSTTATCNLAGIEPQPSEGYTYYIMYPYRESVSEGLAVGATFSGSTADEFFSSVISGWEPSATQNTLAMHKAQDLQVSKVVIVGQEATAKMAHKMGLAKVVLGTKSVTTSTVRTYSTQSTTHNVYTTTKNVSTDVTATSKLSDQTALRLLDAAALTGDGGLWTIVKPSVTAVTLNSVSNDDDAWETSISVSGISAGHYQKYTAQSKRTGTVPLSLVANFEYNNDKTYYEISLDPGTYKLEVWGAQGGDGRIWNQDVEVPSAGGKGGYTTGILTLESAATLYVCIGGKGEKAVYSQKIDGKNYKPLGGYNGGGTGGTEETEPVPENAAGGGGATHIASTLQLSGVLADYVQHKSDVLIVAGGGGGAAGDFPVNYQEINKDNTGDISTSGHDNLASYGLEDNPRASLQAFYGGEGGSIGAGTTYHFGNSSVTANICGVIPCSCPGVADNGDDQFFGQGQEGSTYRGGNIGGTGGGGGGWYGGTYGGNHKNAVSAGGAGGSGHVSNRLTNPGGTVGARSGNGFARITKLN